MENNIQAIRRENLALVTTWKHMRGGSISHDEGIAILENILGEKNPGEMVDMIILMAAQVAEAMEYLEEEMGEPELYQEYCAMVGRRHA